MSSSSRSRTMADDFDFTDMFVADSAGPGNVPDAGTEENDERERRAQEKYEIAVAKKRGGYAAQRDADREKYALSLEHPDDTADVRDLLRQSILAVPHDDLINALDLARVMRMEIKGLKKGKLAETKEVMERYARYLYGLIRGVTDIRGKPSDDPYWSLIDRVHANLDGYIYKGDSRGELVAALNELPEKVDIVYLRDLPKERGDFDIHADAVPREIPANVREVAHENVSRSIIDRIRRDDGLDMESIVADIVSKIAKTIDKSYKKDDLITQTAILAPLMPDANTRVVDRLRDVAGKSSDAITERVNRTSIKAPVNEPVSEPIRAAQPKAPRAPKRVRE